ncbi:hypothetical protein AcV5_006779 [Taiwanofungus camphoratus]|nr:hypothetical protein AcV5_006779 [Antrodia cinnamomea]
MTSGPPPSAAGPSQTADGGHTDSPEVTNSVSTSLQIPTFLTGQSTPALTGVPSPSSSVSGCPQYSPSGTLLQPAQSPYGALRLAQDPITPQYAHQFPPQASGPAVIPARNPSQTTKPAPSGTAAYSAAQTQGQNMIQPPSYTYYNYPINGWGNAWSVGAYPYGATGTYQYSYPHSQSLSQVSPNTHPYYSVTGQVQPKPKTPSPSPSPSPPPEYHKQWDAVIKTFLSSIGFTQAVRGFEADMIVMNPEWERKKVPEALGSLMKDLLKLGESKDDDKDDDRPRERSLDERKLDYLHLVNGAEPRSQTSITKSISRFLAQNRARNDASNRQEFLQSLAEKRRRLNENGDFESSEAIPSCARTDAKTQNRDLQMKYDIAKNEDGPLRRTLKSSVAPGASSTNSPEKPKHPEGSGAIESTVYVPTAERYPALDERLGNIETHLAVRYVPSLPRSLLDRLKFLEDHIIQLEKEYPPWAALHFNQPNRGWPPPPRPTPIIVPSHLTSTAAPENSTNVIPSTNSSMPYVQFPSSASTIPLAAEDAEQSATKNKGGSGRKKSSLHRAVMEKLEVQKAMNDLAGIGGDG